MSKSRFSIDMLVGRVNGDPMSITVLANGSKIYFDEKPKNNTIHLDFFCNLPTKIVFEVGNKNIYDTKLDISGNIIEDKFIKVEKMIVDRLSIPQWILESKLFRFVPNKGEIKFTNYFGANGRASMSIKESDSFDFFLELLSVD